MQSNHVAAIYCLLDTDVAIDYLRRREYALKLFENWPREGLLAVSTITQLEIYQGIRNGEETATNIFLDGLISFAVDVQIARRAGTMLQKLRSTGVTISIADAIIASTALQIGVPLLTNNVGHYPFQGLEIIRGSEAGGTETR